MAVKGYCTLGDVIAAFDADGVTLTTAQQDLITVDLEAVEAAIDAFTGRAWLTGALTGQVLYAHRGLLWLPNFPVTSIEAITAVGSTLPGDSVELTADVDYQLVDASQGTVRLVTGRGWGSEAWASGYILQSATWGGYRYLYYLVDYTPDQTLPALIAWAARETAKSWITPATSGVGEDVSRLTVWHQIDVTFDKSTAQTQTGRAVLGELPTFVQARLRSLKAPIL